MEYAIALNSPRYGIVDVVGGPRGASRRSDLRLHVTHRLTNFPWPENWIADSYRIYSAPQLFEEAYQYLCVACLRDGGITTVARSTLSLTNGFYSDLSFTLPSNWRAYAIAGIVHDGTVIFEGAVWNPTESTWDGAFFKMPPNGTELEIAMMFPAGPVFGSGVVTGQSGDGPWYGFAFVGAAQPGEANACSIYNQNGAFTQDLPTKPDTFAWRLDGLQQPNGHVIFRSTDPSFTATTYGIHAIDGGSESDLYALSGSAWVDTIVATDGYGAMVAFREDFFATPLTVVGADTGVEWAGSGPDPGGYSRFNYVAAEGPGNPHIFAVTILPGFN